MKPRILVISAILLLAIAGGVILWVQDRDKRLLWPDTSSRAETVRISDRDREPASGGTPGTEHREGRIAAEESPLTDARDRMTAQWMKQASACFEKTRQQLVTDLELRPDRAQNLEEVFVRREEQLASLLAIMNSDQAGDDQQLIRKICALIRNKGLREDLAGVLSAEQLKAYDAREEKRQRETVEARAYRDMAEINAVVQLRDSQKQEVLGVLLEMAPVRVEKEADARAFMSLTYGPLAADMDSAHVRGLANLMHMDPGLDPDFEFGSGDHQQWIEEQQAERIENELSILTDVLDEGQLARYREHLEAELPR